MMSGKRIFGYMEDGKFTPLDDDTCKNASVDTADGAIDGIDPTQNFWEQALLCSDNDLKTAIKSSRATNQTEALIRMIKGKDVMNGDKGEIIRIDNGTIIVKLDDNRYAKIEPITIEKSRYDWTNDKEGKRIVRTKHVIASIECWPLKLAYAISIHKSQGQTFSHICCNLGNAFTESLGYVAFSRAKTLDDLAVEKINYKTLEIKPEAIEFNNVLYNTAVENSKGFYQKAKKFFTTKPAKLKRKDFKLRDAFKGE